MSPPKYVMSDDLFKLLKEAAPEIPSLTKKLIITLEIGYPALFESTFTAKAQEDKIEEPI